MLSVTFCDAVDSIESVVKLIATSMVDIKENIDDNLLASYHNGDLVMLSFFLFFYLFIYLFFLFFFQLISAALWTWFQVKIHLT